MSPRRRALGGSLLVALLSFILYFPTVSYDFVGVDDLTYIPQNEAVLSGLTAKGFTEAYHSTRSVYPTPATWISYMIDVELFGAAPAVFHRTNVIIFALSTGLLCWFLCALSGAPAMSLLASALFSVHPLRVESVAWVAGRKDLLAGLFFLLALLAWHRYLVKRRTIYYAAALVATIMSLSSKPVAVILPVFLLVLDWWPFGRWAGPEAAGRGAVYTRLILEKIPFLLLGISSAAAASLRMMVYPDLLSRGERLDAMSWSFFHYLGKTVWPAALAFRSSYSFPLRLGLGTLVSFIVVTAIGSGIYLLRRRMPSVTAGWCLFALAVIPVSGIQQTGAQLYADRFTYFPHLGLVLGLVGMAGGMPRPNKAFRYALAATGVILVTLMIPVTRRQLPYWRSGLALMEHSRRMAPDDPVVAMYLGAAYGAKGRFADAVKYYLEGLKKLDAVLAAHLDVAHYAELLGMSELAESHYRRAFDFQPNNPGIATDLGFLLVKQGRIAEAFKFFDTAVRLAPDDPVTHFNLAQAEELLDRPAEAEDHYRLAARLDPRWGQARLKLAVLLASLGRDAEAAALYQEALRLNVGSIGATRGDDQHIKRLSRER